MTTQNKPLPVAPPGFLGTLPEWMVFEELVRLGKIPGEDFSFQTSLLGGRERRGGIVVDFLFSDPPTLAINVQGTYFHRGNTIDTRDRLTAAQLASQGITLVFLDEEDIYKDVRFYVREALQFVDHSRLGRGG